MYELNKVLLQKWRQASFSYLDQPRPDHGLLLVLRGRIDFVMPAERLSAKAGDLLFLPKGSCYEARFYGEAENYLVNFEGDAPCNVPTLLMQNAPCRERFRQLEEERFASFFRREGLFYLLLDEIFTRRTPEDATLERARALLAEGKGVAEVAAACHISESSLRRLFKEKLGISPVRCRTEVRLARAMELLESGIPVGTAAEELGFYDTAYFCRSFKRFSGVTPVQYAKKRQRSL